MQMIYVNYVVRNRRSEAFLRRSAGGHVALGIVAQQSRIVLLIAGGALQTVAHVYSRRVVSFVRRPRVAFARSPITICPPPCAITEVRATGTATAAQRQRMTLVWLRSLSFYLRHCLSWHVASSSRIQHDQQHSQFCPSRKNRSTPPSHTPRWLSSAESLPAERRHDARARQMEVTRIMATRKNHRSRYILIISFTSARFISAD